MTHGISMELADFPISWIPSCFPMGRLLSTMPGLCELHGRICRSSTGGASGLHFSEGAKDD